MVSKLLKYKYVVAVCLVVGVLSVVNYTPGTWLTGWDDSHPEFNFGLNLFRTINGVWKEHRGLGLVSGLAHSAQLFRYLFLWMLSPVIPASFIRYFWQFLMLLIGPLGVFFFSEKILFRRLGGEKNKAASFLAGLFYLLNLATLQTFYVPLETFTTQFGFLPWLFMYVFKILERPNKKDVIIFTFLNVVSASQAFTPTLFFAYLSFVFLIFLGHLIATRSMVFVRSSLIVLSIITVANLYWLLPFGYFLASGSASNISEATINVLSSEESFLMNNKYGNVADAAVLKGFLFSTTDFNQASNSYEWLLDKWIIYQAQGHVKYLGYVLFAFMALGFVSCVLNRKTLELRTSAVFILFLLTSFFFLMGGNPPLGFLFSFLQRNVPFLDEALRSPFTKYSLLAGFTYACLFGVGVTLALDVFAKLLKSKLLYRTSSVILFTACILLMFFWTLPMFQGGLIYERMRVKVPQEYFAVFDWFNRQENQGRILKLPVQTYWSWGFNDWGYRGSGFTWYGIKQPTIDRAFDVWNPKNESVYREVSYAVYSNNPDLFNSVLKKYGVSYILLDESVYEPRVSKTAKFMGLDSINNFLSDGRYFKLEQGFGVLRIYSFGRISQPLVELHNDLPHVVPDVEWLPEDSAYLTDGEYLTQASKIQNTYPFRDVGDYMALKSDYTIESPKDAYRINLNFDEGGTLQIPNYFSEEKSVLAKIRVTNGDLVITPELPQVLVNNREVVYSKSASYSLKLPYVGKGPFLFSVDNDVYGPFSSAEEGKFIGSIYLDLTKNHVLSLWSFTLTKKTDLLELYKNANVDSCVSQDYGSYGLERLDRGFRLTSENNTACVAATKGLLRDLGLFSFDYNGSFANAKINYCVYGASNCLNDSEYDNKYLLLEESPLPFTVQIYSSPIDLSKPAVSQFDSVNLVQYPLIFSKTTDFSDFAKPDSSASEVIIGPGLLSVEVPKPADYRKAYIYENFDRTDLKSIAHDCGFYTDVGVETDFRKTLNFVKKEIQVTTEGKSSCFTLGNKYLSHNTGYFVEIPFKHIAGENQKICLQNSYTERCDLVYKLNSQSGDGFYQNGRFLIPSYNDGGYGYKLTIENTSIGKEKAINSYDDVGVYPFPYGFVNSIKVVKEPAVLNSDVVVRPMYSKVSNFLYKVTDVNLRNSSTLVLNQSFENGWVAWCGFKPCRAEHVLANNWANGWNFGDEAPPRSLIIFFWPQVLEYVGFIALLGWFIIIVRGSTNPNNTRMHGRPYSNP